MSIHIIGGVEEHIVHLQYEGVGALVGRGEVVGQQLVTARVRETLSRGKENASMRRLY